MKYFIRGPYISSIFILRAPIYLDLGNKNRRILCDTPITCIFCHTMAQKQNKGILTLHKEGWYKQ